MTDELTTDAPAAAPAPARAARPRIYVACLAAYNYQTVPESRQSAIGPLRASRICLKMGVKAEGSLSTELLRYPPHLKD